MKTLFAATLFLLTPCYSQAQYSYLAPYPAYGGYYWEQPQVPVWYYYPPDWFFKQDPVLTYPNLNLWNRRYYRKGSVRHTYPMWTDPFGGGVTYGW